MTKTEQNQTPDHALGATVRAKAALGTHLAPGEPDGALFVSHGTGALGDAQDALSVAPGTGVVRGVSHTIDIDTGVDVPVGDGLPRRDALVLTDAGTLEVEKGTPAALRWPDHLSEDERTTENAVAPAPPDMADVAGLVLATVFVEANSRSLGTGAISNVRVPAPLGGSGGTVLRGGMGESAVREAINTAPAGSTFDIAEGASWTLSDTLRPGPQIGIVGYPQTHGRGDEELIFNRGFDGPLLETSDFLNLTNVSFSGEFTASGHTGPIITDGSETATRQLHFSRVIARDTDPASAAYELHNPYISEFEHCVFFDSGIGLDYHFTGESHHGQNLWAKPWIGRCGTAVRYAQPVKDEAYVTPTVSECDVAFECDVAATNIDAYAKNIRVSDGNLANNGVVWLQRQGDAASVKFENCQMDGDHSAAPAGLTAPVGLFHIEGGTVGLSIDGGYSNLNADSHLFSELSAATTNHQLVVSGAGGADLLRGDITGADTLLTMLNAGVHEGTVTVASGVGLDPAAGGLVTY